MRKTLMTALASVAMLTWCTQGQADTGWEVPMQRAEVSQDVYNALSICKWMTIYDCMQNYPYDAHVIIDVLWIKNTDD